MTDDPQGNDRDLVAEAVAEVAAIRARIALLDA